jgi:hypothetical protein
MVRACGNDVLEVSVQDDQLRVTEQSASPSLCESLISVATADVVPETVLAAWGDERSYNVGDEYAADGNPQSCGLATSA